MGQSIGRGAPGMAFSPVIQPARRAKPQPRSDNDRRVIQMREETAVSTVSFGSEFAADHDLWYRNWHPEYVTREILHNHNTEQR